MRFVIHYNGAYEDSLMVEGETIDEVRATALSECNLRGWEEKDCWSEKVQEKED
jgi:hypothetical protein